jgi:hypothetical protein
MKSRASSERPGNAWPRLRWLFGMLPAARAMLRALKREGELRFSFIMRDQIGFAPNSKIELSRHTIVKLT